MPVEDQPSERKWFRLSAGEITAVCSTIIALVALTYTIATRRDDLIYREASVRPSLAIYFSDNFSLILENFGLGPAVINYSVVGFGDTCIDSRAANLESWNVAIEATGLRIADGFLKDVHDKLSAVDESYREAFRKVQFLPNGSIVGSSQARYVIWFSTFVTLAKVEMKQMPDFRQVFGKLRDDFPPLGVRFYYRVNYSSLTGGHTSSAEYTKGMRCN